MLVLINNAINISHLFSVIILDIFLTEHMLLKQYIYSISYDNQTSLNTSAR